MKDYKYFIIILYIYILLYGHLTYIMNMKGLSIYPLASGGVATVRSVLCGGYLFSVTHRLSSPSYYVYWTCILHLWLYIWNMYIYVICIYNHNTGIVHSNIYFIYVVYVYYQRQSTALAIKWLSGKVEYKCIYSV